MVIIDDEKWVIKSLKATIQDQQMFTLVKEAYDGISGLQLLQDLKPELAFVDVQMPGKGGLELIQAAKELGLPTLFIVISGYAEFAYVQKAMFLGAISYCLKPFSKTEIYECMEKAYLCINVAGQSAKEEIETFDSDKDSSNKRVDTMLAYIHKNYTQDISIQNLAEWCGINPSYVGQLFRRGTGETFSAYLTRYRVEKAVKLLPNSKMSIAAVAESVGYRDYFYFAKIFKKTTGETPSDFRAKAIKKAMEE